MEFSTQLQKAEQLTRQRDIYSEDDALQADKELFEGMKIYNSLCLNNKLSNAHRFKAIRSYVKFLPNEGYDVITRLRDSIPFLKGKELYNIIELLQLLIRCPDISSHMRVDCAVTLYNRGYISEALICFSDLSVDTSLLVDYKVEVCRYLFATQEDEYVNYARECLLDIINTISYESDYRYKIIVGYITNKGIRTFFNQQKINISYNEPFVYDLQNAFFFNEKNGIRERILSGQHLLQMEMVTDEQKTNITQIFLSIASNTKNDDRIRADAADVALREGFPYSVRIEARQLIAEIGYAAVDGRVGGTLIDRTRTIYNNAENVHDVYECVEPFIERILTETTTRVKPFTTVHTEVVEYVRSKISEARTKYLIFKALNRISIDTAVFSKFKVNLAEIFVHVWTRILSYDEETTEFLKDRLIEELADMGDTCSSGHAARLVNVFSDTDDSLVISWKVQIQANITGRLNARIRDAEPAEKDIIALGSMEDADPEDKEGYKTFITNALSEIKGELESEFVDEGYLNMAEFETYFDESIASYK
jgi:hypothetical protein